MKKSRICWIRILFPVLSVLLFSIFLLTIKVNAADNDGPAYFPMGQNDNNIFTEALLNACDTQFNSTDNYVILRYNNHNTGTGRYNFFYIRFPKTNSGTFYGEVNSNGYQFSLYKAGSGTFYQGSFYVTSLTNPTIQGLSTSTNGALGNWTNLNSSLYDSTKSYVSNFKIWSSNSENRYVILNYGPEGEIFHSHATPPDEFDDPVPPVNHTLPHEVPSSPTTNNYTWITYNPPSIDTTNVESLLESLIYVINYLAGWLRDNLAGEFQNLISNIQGFITYIGETIQYYGGLIISNIQNAITTFYNNMVSLIEPLVETVSNIGSFVAAFYALGLDSSGNFALTQMFTSLFVPSTQEMLQVVLDHDEFGIATFGPILITTFKTIYNQILGVTATTTFHVPSCTFHGVEIGNFDISYAWFLPYKAYYDAIISAFLIIGYVYWVIVSASHFLRGHVGQGSDPAPADNYAAGWHYDL